MTRYLLLNGIVLLVVILLLRIVKLSRIELKNIALTGFFVSVLTAIFDPLIILAGIVAYNRQFTLGVNFWNAPIEDFAYALVAAIIVPLLWRYYEKH